MTAHLHEAATECSTVSSPFPMSDLWSRPGSSVLHSRSPAKGDLISAHSSTRKTRLHVISHPDLEQPRDVFAGTLESASATCFSPSPFHGHAFTSVAHMAESTRRRDSYPPTAFSLQCPCWKYIPQLTYATSTMFKCLSEWLLYWKGLIMPCQKYLSINSPSILAGSNTI